MVNKRICDKCNKEISLSNFKKHYEKCGNRQNKVNIYKQPNGFHKCPICEKEYDNPRGVKFHIWAIHSENRVWDTKKGRPSKLKGRKNGPRDLETKRKISINNKGWITGGKCKWYEIIKPDGTKIKVQGTYEKRFAVILNIIDKDWIKPFSDGLSWTNEFGEIHTYYPDFWCPNLKKFFEVKGRYEEEDKKKMRYILSNYNNIEMIFLSDIQNYEKIFNIKL